MSAVVIERTLWDRQRYALVPLLVALMVVLTIWLRFDNGWAENDTVVLTQAGRAVLDEGTITPSRFEYDHGFAYPSLLAMLSAVTGVEIRDVQFNLLPWVTLFTALMAFLAFRAVTRNARAGAIAASLLLVQPDFLFVSQRGSHEKMTWTMVLGLLFCLVASLEGRRLRQTVPYVIIFYLFGFAMLTTNAFFGSSFTTVVLLSLVGAVVVTRRFFRVQASRRLVPRLGYVFLVLTCLAYVVVFYLYAPAGRNIANLARVGDRLAALYLNVDTNVEQRVEQQSRVTSNAQVSRSSTVSSPYSSISLGWTSTATFVMLTLFTWVMMVVAFLVWLLLAVTFVRRGVARSELPLFLIWAFTAAAGVQIALSVAADFAGTLGSNLQLRLFPVFNVFAIPMIIATATRYRVPQRSKLLRYAAIAIGVVIPTVVAVAYPAATIAIAAILGLGLYVGTNWHRSIWARRIAATAAIGAFAYFSVAAVLKATNDPLVSNKWTFYDDAEALGLRWSNANMVDLFVWADYDERLRAASVLEQSDANATSASWTSSRAASVRYVLMSDVIEARAKRVKATLPQLFGTDRIYDNGSTQVVHYLPETPYQP
jgi:hypothetical protein